MKMLPELLKKDKCQWNYVHFKIDIAQNARYKIPAVSDLRNSELSATENLKFCS